MRGRVLRVFLVCCVAGLAGGSVGSAAVLVDWPAYLNDCCECVLGHFGSFKRNGRE